MSSSLRSTNGLAGLISLTLVSEYPEGHRAPAREELAVQPAVVGLEGLHQAPERGRVIHVLQVRKLVDEEVPHHLGPQEDERAIEAHRAASRAAAPAGALAAKGHPLDGIIQIARKPEERWG